MRSSGVPAARVLGGLGVPDRVPGLVVVEVAVVVVVFLDPVGIDAEVVAGGQVVVGRDVDADEIRRGDLVPARQTARDRRAVLAQAGHAEVDGVVVVEDLDHRLFAGLAVPLRFELGEAGGRRGVAPTRLVEETVDLDTPVVDPLGDQGRLGTVATIGRGGIAGALPLRVEAVEGLAGNGEEDKKQQDHVTRTNGDNGRHAELPVL